MFPSLTQVLQTLFTGIVSGQITTAIVTSMSRLLIGFSIATVLGLFLGYLIWRSKLVEDTLGFLVTALQSIPSIVWFPLAIIWFGLNDFSILFIVTIGATWTMTINATSGFKNVPRLYQRVAKTLGSERFSLFTNSYFASICSANHIGITNCLGIFMACVNGRGTAWWWWWTWSSAWKWEDHLVKWI